MVSLDRKAFILFSILFLLFNSSIDTASYDGFDFDKLKWAQVKCGDKIRKGDIIRTKENSEVEIEFNTNILSQFVIDRPDIHYYVLILGETTYFIFLDDFFRPDIDNPEGKITKMEGIVEIAKVNDEVLRHYPYTVKITTTKFIPSQLKRRFVMDEKGKYYDIPENYVLYSETLRQPWLGMYISPTNLVEDVIVGGPAYFSGIKKGDIIVEVDGKKMSAFSIRNYISNLKIGDKVKMGVLRNDKKLIFEVLVGAKEPCE